MTPEERAEQIVDNPVLVEQVVDDVEQWRWRVLLRATGDGVVGHTVILEFATYSPDAEEMRRGIQRVVAAAIRGAAAGIDPVRI